MKEEEKKKNGLYIFWLFTRLYLTFGIRENVIVLNFTMTFMSNKFYFKISQNI